MAHGYFNLPGGGRGRDAGVSGLKMLPTTSGNRSSGYFNRPGAGPPGLRAGSNAHGGILGVNKNYDPKTPLSARQQRAAEGLATHHADVPVHGGHGGGNPNHDEHGRFT